MGELGRDGTDYLVPDAFRGAYARLTRRLSTGSPSTRQLWRPGTRLVRNGPGMEVIPAPLAARRRRANQSLARWVTWGRPGRPGQTPICGSSLEDIGAIQGAPTSFAESIVIRRRSSRPLRFGVLCR